MDTLINRWNSLSQQQREIFEVYAVSAGAYVISSGVNSPQHMNYLLDHNGQANHAWIAPTAQVGHWIQVSLENPKLWTGIITQGRGDADQWVTTFRVLYTNNGKIWEQVEGGKIYYANTDRNTKVFQRFDVPVYARALRIYPLTWNGHVCMRFDAIYSDLK